MSFSVDSVPGSLRVDPDAAGEDNRRRRGRGTPKRGSCDSVSISDEARRRLSEGDEAEPDGEEPI